MPDLPVPDNVEDTVGRPQQSPGSAKLTLLIGVIRVHLPGGPAGPEEAVAGVDKKRDKRNERQ